VSEMPAAHFASELQVIGATIIASAGGRMSGASGCLYWVRTVWPVLAASVSVSMKRRPSGEAMTQTSQPSACASSTSVPMSRAAGEPVTMA
jgi:hypothetical protein